MSAEATLHRTVFLRDESETVGVDDSIAKITGWLSDEGPSHFQPRRHIAVVGMGGMGKTHVFKTESGKFDKSVRLTISQSYSPKTLQERLGREIFLSVKNVTGEEARESIFRCLGRRRSLLVLDDVWSGKHLLDDLGVRDEFCCKVIVSTRDRHRAEELRAEIHGIPCLSKENSWRLFCRHVFPTNGVPPKELEVIAREIEGKCRRLPLAIKRAAGSMARRQLPTEWCDMDPLNDLSAVFMLVLEMSYEGLPSHLKLCFPFCSEFHEDYEIECEILKAFWIGEGIICGGERTETYDVAEGCLNELIKQPKTSPEMESCFKFGGNLLENKLKRVWKDTSERPFRVKIGDKMRKFLIDILKESVKIHWLGVGFSVVGYALESIYQVSAERCVKLLRYMLDLAKHVRELNDELSDNKDVVDFIVQGRLMCVSQMNSYRLFRLISAPVYAEEIKKIESKLALKYQDLTIERIPSTQGQNPAAGGCRFPNESKKRVFDCKISVLPQVFPTKFKKFETGSCRISVFPQS